MPIEFRCPQCQKLLRVGDDAAGKQAKCPSCSALVNVPAASAGDEFAVEPLPPVPPAPTGSPFGPTGANPFGAPALPQRLAPASDNPYAAPLTGGASASGFDPSSPLADGSGPPWERDGASFSSLVATIKEAFSSPTRFFLNMRTEGGVGKPLLFYFILNAAAVLVNFAVQFGIQGVMVGVLPQQPAGGVNPLAMFAGVGIFTFFFALVMIPISFFIWSAILHVALMIFGGANRSFETTMRVVAYAGATAAIALIPFCGSYVQGIVNLVFTGIGLYHAHRTDGWRAALAVIAPMVCCIGGGIALAVVIFSGLAAAGGAGNAGPGFQPQPFDPNQFQIEENWKLLQPQALLPEIGTSVATIAPNTFWKAARRRFNESVADFAPGN